MPPRKTRNAAAPAPLTASQVHSLAMAMATALDLPGGDIRLQPVSEREVLVLNYPGQTWAQRTGRRS